MNDKLLFPESDEPRGKYVVWHKESDGYIPVASVNCGNLLAAMVLPDVKPGTLDTESVTRLVDGARGIDFGDVIVNPVGDAYRLDKGQYGPMFQKIDFPQHEAMKALFNEWTRDYAAAKERDAFRLLFSSPAQEQESPIKEIQHERGGR
jgi:hypothetical protein